MKIGVWSVKVKLKDLIKLLKKHNQNKDFVISSNETDLKNYEFIRTYENEGQVEIHINEGQKL